MKQRTKGDREEKGYGGVHGEIFLLFRFCEYSKPLCPIAKQMLLTKLFEMQVFAGHCDKKV